MRDAPMFDAHIRRIFGLEIGWKLDLAVIAAKGALTRSGVAPEEVNHVIVGNALQTSGDAIYGARHVGLGAPEAPEMTMDERVHHLFARMPDAKIHLYGKGERKDRKIGHVNIVGGAGSIDDPNYVAAVRERAERAAHWLSYAVWTDGWDVHGE